MPLQETIPAGRPCWVDLVSADLESVKPFYAQLFGWDFAVLSMDYNTYTIISGPHGPVGGAMQHDANTMGDDPGGWDMYFATSNAQEALNAVATAGGEATVQPMPMEDQGVMAFADDPFGATFGLWQQQKLEGFAALSEHGYPAWFELQTRDFDESVKFYESVLPAELSMGDNFTGSKYATIDVGGVQSAGIRDICDVLPGNFPTGWTICFYVDDLERALTQAKEFGGSVEMEPEETERGFVATLVDPAGARFNALGGAR